MRREAANQGAEIAVEEELAVMDHDHALAQCLHIGHVIRNLVEGLRYGATLRERNAKPITQRSRQIPYYAVYIADVCWDVGNDPSPKTSG